jgi:hypothetical protein
MVDSYDSIPIDLIGLEVSSETTFENEQGYMFDGYTFIYSPDFYPRKLKFLLKIYDSTQNFSDSSKIWEKLKSNFKSGLKKNLTLDNAIYQFNGNVSFTTPPVCIVYSNHLEIQVEFEEV